MALLAGNVIDAARDRHTAFDRKTHPNKMLLRFLSSYVKQLHGKVLALDEDDVRIETTFDLPMADFSAGITLPANVRYVAEASVTYPAPSTDSPVPLDIIQSSERNARNAPANGAWVVNGRLYLAGTAQRWTHFNKLAVSFVLLPPDLVDLDDTLAIPDAAELACVENVALFLARREAQESDGDGKIALSPFVAAATDAERQYLDDVKNNVSGRTFYTLDVYNS
jgi:hypothetical protein